MLPGHPFRDRWALVTGGARGIGLAIARALLEQGSRVVIADVDTAALDEAVAALSAHGEVHGVELDVTDADAFHATVAQLESTHGALDILVNNAGIMRLGAFLERRPEEQDQQLDINLRGVMHGMRAALPAMKRRGRGHVVNIASTAGRVGLAHGAVYAASKHAVIGLTEAVHAEVVDDGIDLCYICPAPVQTDLIAGLKPMRWPPVCTPEQVAAAVIDAIRRRRVEVYVPRAARLAAMLPSLLPRRAVALVARVLGADRVFSEANPSERHSYEARLPGGATTETS